MATSHSDPLWQRVETPVHTSFGCLGQRVEVLASDAVVLGAVADVIGRFEVPAHSPSDIRLTIVAAPDDGAEAVGGDVPAAAADAIFRERGDQFVAADGRGGVVTADLARAQITVFVAPAGLDHPSVDVLIASPLWRVCAWRGLTTVHAAAVIVDGITLVLRGASGAGKSTLAALAARAGQSVLAEESVWFDPLGRTVCLRGRPWTIHLADPMAEGSAAASPARDQKQPLDVASDLGGHAVERAALGPLVLLDPGAATAPRPPTWQPLAPSAARAHYEAMTIPGEMTQDPMRWTATREALLAEGAYLLVVGEPAATYAALGSLVDSLTRDAGTAP